MNSIPFAKPYLPMVTVFGVAKQILMNQISGNGNAIKEAELRLGKVFGTNNCLLVNNGTSAIRLALMSLKLSTSDTVVLPGWGFHAASNIAHSMGLQIRYIDVDLSNWNVKPERYLEHLSAKVWILIHSLGFSESLLPLDGPRDCRPIVIEDCAQAIFSRDPQGILLGSRFEFSTFSFHAAKTLTCGEGGLLLGPNWLEFDKTRSLRSHGYSAKHYFHEFAGDNFRMSNVLGSILIPQLKKVRQIIEKRQKIYQTYREMLIDLPEVVMMNTDSNTHYFPWGFGVRIVSESNDSHRRDYVMKELMKLGIETRNGYSSATSLPYLDNHHPDYFSLPNSKRLENEVVFLPFYQGLKHNEIEFICGSLRSIMTA